MKAERPYPQVRVTRKGERALAAGHPWVYAAEVTEADESIRDGGLADIVSGKGAYLGTGFYNSHSLIRCRLLSRNANDRFDDAFWQRRGCSMPGTTARASCSRRTCTAAG